MLGQGDTGRPLLYAIDGGGNQLYRGSAIPLSVDEDGASDVSALLAAAFNPVD